MQILIIEDNKAIASNLCDYLEARTHIVDIAHDGLMGWQLAKANQYDAILLDLGLPKMEGIKLCKRLREELLLDTPILILTARDTLEDKLLGFQTGADDYLVKPFALEEVAARLDALHKRHHRKVASKPLQLGELLYEPRAKRLSYQGTAVALPPKCLQLIELLLHDPQRVYLRREIERELWGEEQDSSDRLRYHIRLLRSALIAAGLSDPIQTIHGVGYSLLHRHD
ncbi:response regulator transcription factor [Herminiimonas glaciei]|uniref:Response regulator transcription factor n=1 Tax=Herminiimonas glaciei TaxID=523788 RepID=A0ABW2I6X9_9BURK